MMGICDIGLFALDTGQFITIAGNSMYGVLLLQAIFGAFYVVMVWLRVAQKRFKSEEEQEAFLAELEPLVASGRFNEAEMALDGDVRAMPQLALLALRNRDRGLARVRQIVTDRFTRDVLGDLEHQLSWVHTMIKSAPMVGLLGTVLGMMGAFGKLAGSENVSPTVLASDINVALITTACGLTIAIPLIVCVNSINVRIRKMEDLVAVGLTHFFEILRAKMSSKA